MIGFCCSLVHKIFVLRVFFFKPRCIADSIFSSFRCMYQLKCVSKCSKTVKHFKANSFLWLFQPFSWFVRGLQRSVTGLGKENIQLLLHSLHLSLTRSCSLSFLRLFGHLLARSFYSLALTIIINDFCTIFFYQSHGLTLRDSVGMLNWLNI